MGERKQADVNNLMDRELEVRHCFTLKKLYLSLYVESSFYIDQTKNQRSLKFCQKNVCKLNQFTVFYRFSGFLKKKTHNELNHIIPFGKMHVHMQNAY